MNRITTPAKTPRAARGPVSALSIEYITPVAEPARTARTPAALAMQPYAGARPSWLDGGDEGVALAVELREVLSEGYRPVAGYLVAPDDEEEIGANDALSDEEPLEDLPRG